MSFYFLSIQTARHPCSLFRCNGFRLRAVAYHSLPLESGQQYHAVLGDTDPDTLYRSPAQAGRKQFSPVFSSCPIRHQSLQLWLRHRGRSSVSDLYQYLFACTQAGTFLTGRYQCRTLCACERTACCLLSYQFPSFTGDQDCMVIDPCTDFAA